MHTNQIPIHNPGESTMYVGAIAIPSGETRHIEKHLVPRHLWPTEPEVEAEASPADDRTAFLSDLSALSVAKLKAAIKDLSEADLSTLTDLEQAKGDGARKSVLELLGAEILSRAANPAGDALVDKDEAEIVAALSSLTTIDLVTLLEAETAKGDAARPGLVAAIGEEQVKRANVLALGQSGG